MAIVLGMREAEEVKASARFGVELRLGLVRAAMVEDGDGDVDRDMYEIMVACSGSKLPSDTRSCRRSQRMKQRAPAFEGC